ncbi:acyltransferase [Burkholderia sp. Bp9143]|uniref:acyltransferase family protein n=1 Tax=Burkholderia sp. Bp9143 TaxID=2184574 RepID=UPI000F5A3F76|nr:acyltransferase [Burkholderia sp. Bp9143]RQR28837.1 acyltransferase [Burkholderia sp. Bp9143]
MSTNDRKPDNQTARVFGLDVLRAIAVLSVLAGHSLAHGTPPGWLLRYIGPQAITGVEIFYVLSGFLIGHILLRSAASGRLHTVADIVDFWKRRWARTLPLYVFFLIVYMRFDYHGVADVRQIWPFFLFLQNFAWPTLPFFTHSWSLAVEEWFYLLLPVVFVTLRLLFKSDRRALAGTAILFVGVPLACRVVFGRHVADWSGFDANVRSIVVCRLDSLFIGVLCAYVRLNHPRAFARVARCWPVALAAFLVLGGLLSVNSIMISDHPVARVVYFPLLSLSVACLMPAALQWKSTGIAVLDAFVTHTSKVSYSLYLGHIAMLTTMLGLMDRFGWKADDLASTVWMYVGLAVLYYLFANLTYLFVEQPYIKLRDVKLGHSDTRSGNVAVAMPQHGDERLRTPAGVGQPG